MTTAASGSASGRLEALQALDPDLYEAVIAEEHRQETTLDLIASENIVPPVLLELQATRLMNKAAVEGFPGRRFHAGTVIADRIEALAIERAKRLFGAEYANVQPHSGSSANLAVFAATLEPGDRIIAMSTKAGGHVSHGTKLSLAGRIFPTSFYGLDPDTELINFDAIGTLARRAQPKLIVAGSSSYAREIDFVRFREIADEVGALLLVDMAHIAGLVAAGVHQSPVPSADVVTATLFKTLRGPKGAFILSRGAYGPTIDRAIFPGTQGSTNIAQIACMAYTFLLAGTPEFRRYAGQVVANARTLAARLADRGLRPVGGGTDTHMVVLDLRGRSLTGIAAQTRLEEIGIAVNRNQIPDDPLGHDTTSGIRIGTSAITARGLREPEVEEIAEVIDRALSSGGYGRADREALRRRSRALCDAFPLGEVR
jgi:glycine hydroxymethyltransferase